MTLLALAFMALMALLGTASRLSAPLLALAAALVGGWLLAFSVRDRLLPALRRRHTRN